jgi:hypothetical protein
MNERLTLTMVEIATPEEFIRMTPEERLDQNNAMANRVLEIEAFMEKFYLGWDFIQSHKSQCLAQSA